MGVPCGGEIFYLRFRLKSLNLCLIIPPLLFRAIIIIQISAGNKRKNPYGGVNYEHRLRLFSSKIPPPYILLISSTGAYICCLGFNNTGWRRKSTQPSQQKPFSERCSNVILLTLNRFWPAGRRLKIRWRNLYGGGNIFRHRPRLQCLNLCSKCAPPQVLFSLILIHLVNY